jgi:hypothetical protein
MKASIAPPLAVLLLAGVSLTAQEVSKETKPAAAPAAPADPFVKKREKAGAEAGSGPATSANVGGVFQYIDVSRERWQKWLDANQAPVDAGALRREVEAWIAEGDAALAETSLVMGKTGQRSKVESVRNQAFPTEFGENAAGQPFPTTIECRNVGTTSETDVVIASDTSVDFNFAPERVACAGEVPPREETGVGDGDVRFPLFITQKVTTMTSLDPRQWALVGCETSLAQPETRHTLVFVRPVLHRFEEAAAEEEAPTEVMLAFTWIETSHEAFNASLMKGGDLSAWIGGGLREEVAKAGGKVVEEKVVRVRNGQRSKVESIREMRHATDFLESSEGGFATPNAFESRNIGTTVEVDPVISPAGGMLDLNLAAEFSSFWGHDVLHRILVEGEWKPNVTMPAFYTMQPTTQLSLPVDVPVLVAVMSPPDEKGWTDPSRKVLLFVKFSR